MTRKTKRTSASVDSTDESSDNDIHVDIASEDDDVSLFRDVSPKFRQIITHQGGPDFAAFVKPLALQVATKADLSDALSHFRAGFQSSRALCHVNNLSISHESSTQAFQPKQIPVILPQLRAQPHLSFSLTQSVAPVAIHQFLQ